MALLFGLGGLLLLGVPIAAIVALVKSFGHDTELGQVQRRLAVVEKELAGLRDSTLSIPHPVPEPATEPPPVPEPQPVPEPEPVSEEAVDVPPIVAVDRPAPPPLPQMAGEQALAERWLVWLGGLALALGGAFLVKYSAEQGLLGPLVRVSMGAVTGIGAILLGHWLSRRPMAATALPWHVPPALVGAGASMVFASLYAAYGLYDLMSPLMAFAALAATAAATVLLSLGHGPFVALLGLIGAFAVPLLVRSTEPNAIGLFAYLLVLSAGALALLRWRQWWWLAWAILGGSSGWVLLWLGPAWRPGDELVQGVFLCALFGLFAAFRLGLPNIALFAGTAEAPMVRRVLAIAAATMAGLVLVIVHRADFTPVALALLFALSIAFLAFAWRDQVFDRLPWIGGILAILVLAGWDAGLREAGQVADLLAQPLPGEAGRFAWNALGFAILFGAAGFAGTALARPWRWAILSAAAALALLAVSYWRLAPLGYVWAWTMGALALAVLTLAAAERMGRRRTEPGVEAALAAYAIGTIGALALAATFALEEAWLTVALAALPAAIAWVDLRLRVVGLRKVALVLAALVLVRLGLNPYVLDYPIGDQAVFSWLLYGYGLPMLAFAGAARLFRRTADDVLVAVLEAGAIALAVLLVSLEIRHLMAGGLSPASGYSLAERSAHSVSWLAGAAVLFVAHGRNGRLIPLRAGQILLAGATAQVILLQALWGNPLFTGARVGEMVIFNRLLLSFAAPACLYVLHSRVAPPSPPWLRSACAALALGLAFLWATLEVRHAFVGSVLRYGRAVQAEQWAYSVLYLLGGVAVLVGGIVRGSAGYRRAGLAIVLVVVAKVFLVDLSQTTGIWRALSFLGLGAGLVGVGWIYRRLARPS